MLKLGRHFNRNKENKDQHEHKKEDNKDPVDNDDSEKETSAPKKTEPLATKQASSSKLNTDADDKDFTKHKTNVAQRLAEAVDARGSTNRSPDLVPLSQDYEKLRKLLRATLTSTKNYHAAMLKMDQARLDVLHKVKDISGTEWPHTNVIDDNIEIHDQVTKRSVQKFLTNYQDKVIDYVEEWERVTSSRVDQEQAAVKKLNTTLTHYQNKTNKLRNNVHKTEARNANAKDGVEKEMPKALLEKAQRNEEKLESAWQEYETAASRLCDLLEEATKCGYHDLYPVLVSMINIEKERSNDEHFIFAQQLVPLTKKLEANNHGQDKNKSMREVTPALQTSSPKVAVASPKSNNVDNSSFAAKKAWAHAKFDSKANVNAAHNDDVSETSSGFSDQGADEGSDSSAEHESLRKNNSNNKKKGSSKKLSSGSSADSPARVSDV